MRPLAATLLAALALAVAPLPADAVPGKKKGVSDEVVLSSSGFLGGHPDMANRLQGLESYRKQNYTRALQDFRRAARYADKPSQGMIAEMHWLGHGVPVDRATAYAWMDLAAERAYPMLLIKREQYWNELTEEERARAVEIGGQLYAEYGDDVAKPRMERVLRRVRREMTGSRTGFVGALEILVQTPHGMRSVDGSQFYAEKFWNPALYWRWQDYDWKKPGEGKVDVGEVMTDAQGVLTDPNEPVAEPGDPVEPAIPEGDERR